MGFLSFKSKKIHFGLAAILAISLSACSISTSNSTSPLPSPPASDISAATFLGWASTSPSYSLSVNPNWTLASGGSIASQSIQYYSDGVCGTPSGSPFALSATATTHNFTGSDATTYSYKITTVPSSGGASVVSACSSSMVLNSVACVGARLTNSPYADGTGTTLDPYLICTAAQMNAIGANSAHWSKSFKLLSDIDLAAYTGTQYKIIGDSTTSFTGVFDGNDHTISNLTYNDSVVNGVGLIGYMSGSSAEVKNLKLSNVSLTTGNNNVNVGAVVGTMTGGTVTNCQLLSGSILQATPVFLQAVGGLIGSMTSSTLTNSTSAVTIASGNYGLGVGGAVGRSMTSTITNVGFTGAFHANAAGSNVGGLVGMLSDSTVTSSYSTGAVNSATGSTVGGLVGSFLGTSNIISSYSKSAVFGNAFYVGGFIGQAGVSSGNGVINSYAQGSVSAVGSSILGGFIGRINTGAMFVTNCYASGALGALGTPRGGFVGSDNNSGVNRGVYSKNYFDHTVNVLNGMGAGPTPAGVVSSTTTTMQTTATFSGIGWTSPPWNFTTTGSYLKLSWEP